MYYLILTWNDGKTERHFKRYKSEVYEFLDEHHYEYDCIEVYQYTDAFDSRITLKRHARTGGADDAE